MNDLVDDPDFAALARLTPDERICRYTDILGAYLALGGGLDPDLDPDNPFYVEPTAEQLDQHRRDAVALRRARELVGDVKSWKSRRATIHKKK